MAKKIKALSPKEIEKKLKVLLSWELNKKGTYLTKVFTFPSFINGLAFVAKIAVVAEVQQHHPDIQLTYNAVKVVLTTHDVKGLTVSDFELAKSIDAIKMS